jgi:transglutaminase-like putative cysteine protease
VKVRLRHRTVYRFDPAVVLAPHRIRLRPAPHCPVPVLDYALTIDPRDADVRWHHDPHDNWVARAVFPSLTDRLDIDVRLEVRLEQVNPFGFYMDEWAERYPFAYQDPLSQELAAYLAPGEASPALSRFVDELRAMISGRTTVDALTLANRTVWQRIRYITRDEQGVFAPSETLTRGSGSCRDSAWLLVQALRHLGIAARFTSGYLVQLEREGGPREDILALHAWCEAYLPGAGWMGFDATSGLVTAEGHIPLASVAHHDNGAPVSGSYTGAGSTLSFEMSVERIGTTPA